MIEAYLISVIEVNNPALLKDLNSKKLPRISVPCQLDLPKISFSKSLSQLVFPKSFSMPLLSPKVYNHHHWKTPFSQHPLAKTCSSSRPFSPWCQNRWKVCFFAVLTLLGCLCTKIKLWVELSVTVASETRRWNCLKRLLCEDNNEWEFQNNNTRIENV